MRILGYIPDMNALKTPKVVSILLIFGLFFVSCEVEGQSISASVSPNPAYQGQYLYLDITATGSFDQVELPVLNGFDRLGTSQSTSISVINGHMSRQQQYRITLSATKTGDLVIGPIKLVKNGKVIQSTNPIHVKVLPSAHGYRPGPQLQPQQPPPSPMPQMPIPQPQAPSAGAGKAFFIQLTVPKRAIYVGEPFFVEYDLYIRSDVDVSNAEVLQNPAFQGAVVQELETKSGNGKLRTVNGTTYRVYPQYRAVLTPIRKGKLAIQPMKIRLYIQQFFNARAFDVASKSADIQVKTVPTQGRPAGYYGLVGQFTIRTGLSKSMVAAGTSTVLTVTVAGSGSINSIKRPRIPVDSSITVETLPSTDMDRTTPGLGGLEGKRVFQYLLTPNKPGKFTVPTINLAFFNPLAGRFETVKSEPIELVVTKGKPGVAGIGTQKRDILPILKRFLPERPQKPGKHRPVWLLWVLVLFPFTGYVLVEGAMAVKMRKLNNPQAYRRAMALKNAKKGLKQLDTGNNSAFYDGLHAVITGFLRDRLGVTDTAKLSEALTAAGVKPQTIRALSEQMEAIAYARFAPVSAANRDLSHVLSEVSAVLERIDREAA